MEKRTSNMEYTAKKIDSEEESTPILKKCKISKSIDEKTRERRVTDKVNTSSSPTTKKIRVATNNTTYRFESANSSVATAIVVAPSPGKDGKRVRLQSLFVNEFNRLLYSASVLYFFLQEISD